MFATGVLLCALKFISVGEGRSEVKVNEAMEQIFSRLRGLTQARDHLKQFGFVFLSKGSFIDCSRGSCGL